jgi:folate-binding protein YgfZ
MNTEWHDFLRTQAAEVMPDRLDVHFESTPDPVDGFSLCDLSYQGLISLSGADAASFLQSQISNDINDITPSHSGLGSYCVPKGRMLAIYRAFYIDEAVVLQLPIQRVAPVIQRMSMFVLRSDCTIADLSDDWVRMGLIGSGATAWLTAEHGLDGLAVDGVTRTSFGVVIRHPGIEPRYELFVNPGIAQDLWQQLQGAATLVSSDQWALQDIYAGIPSVYPETSESFVPQMTNLDLLGGISFTKGCYPGQEIVARTAYLGKLKRRMFRTHVDTDTRPDPGTPVYSSTSDQTQGSCVDARPEAGGYAVLAVLRLDAAGAGDLHLGDGNGPELSLIPLPYSFPHESDQ